MMLLRALIYAVSASVLLLVATPFLPSSIFIQLKDLEIEGSRASLTRTVLVPTDGYMTYEIGNGTAHPECNRDGGVLHYERRGTQPVEFALVCDPPPGELIMRYCVQAVAWLGIRLAATCLEEDFWSGPRPEEMLQQQVDELRGRVEQQSLGRTRDVLICPLTCEGDK